jgi:hypothetical protein
MTKPEKFQYSESQLNFIADLRKRGWSWPQVCQEFNSKYNENKEYDALRNALSRAMSSASKSIGAADTKAGIGDIVKNHKKVTKHTYVVVAATPSTEFAFINGVAVPKTITSVPAMKAIETYLDKNKKSSLVVIPMRAHVKAMENQPQTYDSEILKYRGNFATELNINNNIKIFDAQLNPQQINPTTGLHHIGGSGFLFSKEDSSGCIGRYVKNQRSSLIIGHPKQMMEVIPNGKTSLPRIIHSTGTITTKQYLSNRMGRIAAEQHTLGGLIIDVMGDFFYVRQFQCNPETGEFVDLGTRYFASGKTSEERAVSLSLGDLHAGEHDEQSFDAAIDLINFLQPEECFWHDIFTAKSISHHLIKKLVARLRLPPQFKTLEAEGKVCKDLLNRIILESPEDTIHHIVGSNHNNHLTQYLDEQRYFKDDVNALLAHKLQVLYMEGIDPLRVLVDSKFDDPLRALFEPIESRFNWIDSSQDYWIENVQHGEHGHQGIAGARGNKYHHYVAYGKATVGHAHQPSIYNGVYTNGTLTPYKLDYNNSQVINWLHAHTVQYSGGHRQMIVEIDGVYKRED